MPKPKSESNREKITYDLAIQKLLELELLLGLGQKLSQRQLLSLLAKCHQIVKDQLEMLDKPMS
jgi:hypothetical protein